MRRTCPETRQNTWGRPPPTSAGRPPSEGALARDWCAGVDLTRFGERTVCPHPGEPGVRVPGRRQRCAATRRERRLGG